MGFSFNGDSSAESLAKRMRRPLGIFMVSAGLILSMACGGGGGASGGGTTTPATPTSLTISGATGAPRATVHYSAPGSPTVVSPTNGVVATSIASSGTVTADDSGRYSFQVPLGWSGTVTPVKDGYQFNPASNNYVNGQNQRPSPDFVVSVAGNGKRIAGSTGVGDVSLSYVDGTTKTTTSLSDGTYELVVSDGWSGSVTISKTGYTFSPASLSFTSVHSDQASQDYTATAITYTISGNAGLPSTTLSYTDGSAKTATSDGSGNYALTVSYSWSGTVTPSRAGYGFSPANKTYSNTLASRSGENYTAAPITYTVAGTLGTAGAGATLSYTDGTLQTATADASGNYSFTVSYHWSGTVTPSKTGYSFSPANKTYTSVGANQTSQNYTTAAITYTISGSAGVAGATLTYTDGSTKTTTSDGSGNYTVTVPYDWSGSVTPSKTGYSFNPASLSYLNLRSNQTGQNFNASHTITGIRHWFYLPFNAATGVITPAAPEPATPTNPSTYIRCQQLDGTSLPGTYDLTTGTFSVPSVPAGKYWLIRNYDYILTDKDSVDLSTFQGGRRTTDTADPALTTPVQFTTTGLNSWQVNDYVYLYDYNANLYSEVNWESQVGAPALNDTQLSQSTPLMVNWGYGLDTGGPINLVDTSAGDMPRLVQMVSHTISSESVQVASKSYQPSPLTITSGSSATVGGSFSSLSPSDSVYVNFKRSLFATYQGQYNPSSSGHVNGAFITFMALPGASTYGFVGQAAGLLNTQALSGSVSTDLNLGAVSIPTPPAGCEKIVYGGQSHYVPWQLAGSATTYIKGRMFSYRNTLPTPTSPFLPVISPVRNPTINGNSMFSDRTGVGLTPLIAWTAPDLGTPQAYYITIYKLSTNSGQTYASNVGWLCIPGDQTSVNIPAGILTSGSYYGVIIRAYADGAYSPSTAPYLRDHFPYGFADSISNKFMP